LWPEKRKIAVQRLHVHRVVHHRLRAVHQHFRAMLMGQRDQAATGFSVPSTLETWVTASRRVRSSNSAGMHPAAACRPVQRDHPQLAPTRAHSICHGTILAWCSICADDDVIPAPTLAFPQLLATRLIPSVVPRTNTSSSGERALRKAPPAAHVFHPLGRFRAQGMDTAMHGGIAVAIKLRFGIHHRFGFCALAALSR
jgi:hypothetical protein